MIYGKKVIFSSTVTGLAHKECRDKGIQGTIRSVGVMEYNGERYWVVDTPIHEFPLYCADGDIDNIEEILKCKQ